MTKLQLFDMQKLPSGATGFTNDARQWVCTGSQMGRRNTLPENLSGKIKMRLVRLRWVDGDYDSGGAYWGGGNITPTRFGISRDFIYRARGEMEGEEFTIELFIRAKSRTNAKEQARKLLPHASFYN